MKTLTLRRISCRFVESVCSLAIVFLSIASITAQVAPAPVVNGKIVFARGDANGFYPEIFVMDSDGSNQTNLTNLAGARRRGWHGDFGPAWSPDGARIVFASQRVPYFMYWHIYVMNADGSNQTLLTHNDWNRGGGFQYGFERGPAWSPDGSKIAFASAPINSLQIYVMDADGSNQIPLTGNSSPGDEAPAWSPDGSRIAFMRYGAPQTSEIYVMNADGSNQVRLTDTPGRRNELPSWSPDGSKIAFDSNRGITGYAIYVMDADGSNQMALTNDQFISLGPEWSPDGTKIVFTGGSQIFVMDADGSNQTFLAMGRTPRWQRLPAPSR